MANNGSLPPADHLSGKRRWTRQPRTMDVVCVGAGTTVRARTIDISRGGMLVEANDNDVPPISDGDLVPLAFLIAAAFANGMKVILGPDVSVRAEIVRVTTSPIDRCYLRLGCRFQKVLTSRQCAKLGIDESDIPDPALDLTPPADDVVGPTVGLGEAIEVTARPGTRKVALAVDRRRERRSPIQ